MAGGVAGPWVRFPVVRVEMSKYRVIGGKGAVECERMSRIESSLGIYICRCRPVNKSTAFLVGGRVGFEMLQAGTGEDYLAIIRIARTVEFPLSPFLLTRSLVQRVIPGLVLARQEVPKLVVQEVQRSRGIQRYEVESGPRTIDDLPIGGRSSTNGLTKKEAKERRGTQKGGSGCGLKDVRKDFSSRQPCCAVTVRCKTWTGKPEPNPVDVLTGCQGRFANTLALALSRLACYGLESHGAEVGVSCTLAASCALGPCTDVPLSFASIPSQLYKFVPQCPSPRKCGDRRDRDNWRPSPGGPSSPDAIQGLNGAATSWSLLRAGGMLK
ncbi:hypothetical protein QBC37DRAFT_452098 [Rhypophila decipiens]|uniref:Uncharacterized protein n=1 Tax=Rhypophila decipiens TaxID=261697 RepID=A0AAN7BAL9_9PEZI|nr:hypothetical protein QBC37DRAFT_452098 [Rhypophila decipiens]